MHNIFLFFLSFPCSGYYMVAWQGQGPGHGTVRSARDGGQQKGEGEGRGTSMNLAREMEDIVLAQVGSGFLTQPMGSMVPPPNLQRVLCCLSNTPLSQIGRAHV